MRFLEASKNGSFFSGLNHPDYLAHVIQLTPPLAPTSLGKVVPLKSHLAHLWCIKGTAPLPKGAVQVYKTNLTNGLESLRCP